MLANDLSPEVASTLGKIGRDIIQKEQYMDFIRNRYFRCTMLCHKEQVLERNIDPGVISKFHIAAQVEPQTEALNLESLTQDSFKESSNGNEFKVRNPITKVALILLNEVWPCTISFQSLCEKALAKLDRSKDDDIFRKFGSPERALMTELLLCYTADAIELHVCPVQIVTEVSNKPVVTPLAHCQAEAGQSITNQRHERVDLADFARHVIRFLDGQHDRQALVDELMTLLDDGVLVMTDKGDKMEDQVQTRSNLQTLVDNILEQLPARAILIA
jgi:methyltransferase-like protein